jgi:hypothetical protein
MMDIVPDVWGLFFCNFRVGLELRVFWKIKSFEFGFRVLTITSRVRCTLKTLSKARDVELGWGRSCMAGA